MKIASSLVMVACFLFAMHSIVASAESKRPTTLELEMDIVTQVSNSATKQKATETQNHRVWIKDRRLRLEVRTITGTEIQIESESAQYLLNPDEKKGLSKKISKQTERPKYPAFFDAEGLRQWLSDSGARKVGSAKVNGVDCDVYAHSEPGLTAKRWVRQDSLLPVKTVQELSLSSTAKRTETGTIRRIREGTAVADALFVPPKGYAIRDIEELQKPPGGSKQGKSKSRARTGR